MDFKKFKHDIKNEDLNIPNLKENVKAYSKQKNYYIEKRERRSFNFLPILKYIGMAMPIIIMVICIGFASIQSINDPTQLYSIKNEEDLKKVLAYSKDFKFDFIFNNGFKDNVFDEATNGAPGTVQPEWNGNNGDSEIQKPNDDYHDTNVQEEGVDEADVVKTDGKNIYYYKDGIIRIYNIGTQKLSTIELINEDEKCFSSDPLYITDKYIIFLGAIYDEDYQVVIKLFDKETLEEVKSYSNDGNIVDSRLMNNSLYIVFNQRYIDTTSLPCAYIDGELQTYDYTDIKYSKSVINQGFTFLVALNLNTLEIDTDIQLGANYWTAVYATKNSIYLATSNSCKYLSLYTVNGARYTAESYQTNIFRYSISDEGIEFEGIIITSGLIKDQFYLDECDGYLRVMLQQQNNAVTGNNKLEIYDIDKFDKDGYIELVSVLDKGIGKEGEQIKSVRFTDTSCLVVTYLIIDPLYYIDLSDPINPVILGQYEEPGYNTYMHYINDELAIGFGVNNDGYKLGLYELIDGQPNKVDEIDEYNTLPPAYNHKALYIEGEIFGFASSIYNYVVENDMNVDVYVSYIYQIFTINYEGEKPSLQLIKQESNVQYNYERMLRVKENYYLVSERNIIIYDNNFNQVNLISFE